MKKMIIYFLIILFCLDQMCVNVNAQSIKKVYIPDANFRYFLNLIYPGFMDISGDSLLVDKAATFTDTFSCIDFGIKDLSGIEYFVNITELDCGYNELSELPDLSKNSALEGLFCSVNKLTSLPDLSQNIALRNINCAVNFITNLPDLSLNKSLNTLFCSGNPLASLPDLSFNKDLDTLICVSDHLTTLPDLSALSSLTYLDCSDNNLTYLPDLSAITNLNYLDCSNNFITYLPDLSKNLNLSILRCANNLLTVLSDFSLNTNLEKIWCTNNKLTKFPDLIANTKLISLDCSKNFLKSLPKISVNSELTRMICFDNYLDFSDAADIRFFDNLSMMDFFWYYPQKPFGQGDTINLCKGDTLKLSVQSQDYALSYQWFVDNIAINNMTDTTLFVPYATIFYSGKITCKSLGTVLKTPPMKFGPGISYFESNPFIVKVKHAIFTGLDTVYCLDTNSISVTTSPKGGILEGNGIYDTIFYPDSAGLGAHLVIYTYDYSDGCVSSDTLKVTVLECINNIIDKKIRTLEVYPNPANRSLQIKGDDYSYCELYNNLGILITKSDKRLIDISYLSTGQYFIRLILSDGEFQTEKIIIFQN
jgi:hypothetical protein